MIILLMVIGNYFIMAIGGYSIGGYWSLLNDIILVPIVSYYINGHWWLFY
jgi:hypothetical protein